MVCNFKFVKSNFSRGNCCGWFITSRPYINWRDRGRTSDTSVGWCIQLGSLIKYWLLMFGPELSWPQCFLAQRISSINAMSELCEKQEQMYEVAKAIGMDSRIGSKFWKLRWFWWFLFSKRHSEFSLHCKIIRITSGSGLLEQVIIMNDHQTFFNRIVQTLTIRPIKNYFLGWAFKKRY
jgi:hypothetical protein